jgi:hypothetical protein
MAQDDETFPPPLNISDELDDITAIDDMTAIEAGVLAAIKDRDDIGVLTIVTRVGHYDFVIDQEMANRIVQKLREFIAGDSEPLVE